MNFSWIIYVLCYMLWIDGKNIEIKKIEKTAPIFFRSKVLFFEYIFAKSIIYNWEPILLNISIALIAYMLGAVNFVLLIIVVSMYIYSILLQFDIYYFYSRQILFAIPIILFYYQFNFLLVLYNILLFFIHVIWLMKTKLIANPDTIVEVFKRKIIFLKKYNLIMYESLFLLIILKFFNFPIEEFIIPVIFYLVIQLEINTKENKRNLSVTICRYYICRLKKNIVFIDFLLPEQVNKIKFLFVIIFVVGTYIVIQNNQIIGYLIIGLSSLLFLLYSIDYIIQCVILRSSIIYANPVIKKIIDGMIYLLIGCSFTFFVIDKRFMNHEIYKNFTFETMIIQLFLCSIIIVLLLLFIYRIIIKPIVSNREVN